MTQKTKRHLLTEKHCIHQQAFELGCIYENLEFFENCGYTFFHFENQIIFSLRNSLRNVKGYPNMRHYMEVIIDSKFVSHIKIRTKEKVVDFWLRKYFKYNNLENETLFKLIYSKPFENFKIIK
jgi:hypothetical protein